MWFEVFLATLRNLRILGTIDSQSLLCFWVRSVILTTRQRENGNLEFHRKGRYHPQTGPSWELHLRLRRPWL
jgi:hypothetical protein